MPVHVTYEEGERIRKKMKRNELKTIIAPSTRKSPSQITQGQLCLDKDNQSQLMIKQKRTDQQRDEMADKKYLEIKEKKKSS